MEVVLLLRDFFCLNALADTSKAILNSVEGITHIPTHIYTYILYIYSICIIYILSMLLKYSLFPFFSVFIRNRC